MSVLILYKYIKYENINVICQGPTIHMMTDINIWSVGLTQQQVTSWMTCEDDPGLEENRIVAWLTANWTLEGVDVKSIPKNNVCLEIERKQIYPFPSFEKNFLDSVDFCNILKGTVPVPWTEAIMAEIKAACGGSPFTGSNLQPPPYIVHTT